MGACISGQGLELSVASDVGARHVLVSLGMGGDSLVPGHTLTLRPSAGGLQRPGTVPVVALIRVPSCGSVARAPAGQLIKRKTPFLTFIASKPVRRYPLDSWIEREPERGPARMLH